MRPSRSSPRRNPLSCLPAAGEVVGQVAQATTSGKQATHRREWWKDLNTLCTEARRSDRPLLAMLDANARVGSVRSPGIGQHCAQGPDPSGECLARFLELTGAFAPQTYQDSVDK